MMKITFLTSNIIGQQSSWTFKQKQGNFELTTKESTKKQSEPTIHQEQKGKLSKTTRKS